MSSVQDIVFGCAGQSLTWDATEGRPSSVTSVTVLPSQSGDEDTPEAATSGSPTVEAAPNTTLAAAAGAAEANPRLITVASAAGITPGRTYLLSGASGFQEWCEVIAASGQDVTVRLPLGGSYATGDAFVSTRLTVALSDAWVSDDANLDAQPARRSPTAYRARWVYVVAGRTYVHDAYFRLVRYSVEHGVSPVQMEAFAPHWNSTLPTDHREDNGARLIDEGYRQVSLDLGALDLDDAGVMDPEVIAELTMRRTLVVLQEDRFYRGDVDRERLELARQDYHARLRELVPTATRMGDSSGATTVGSITRPIWIR